MKKFFALVFVVFVGYVTLSTLSINDQFDERNLNSPKAPGLLKCWFGETKNENIYKDAFVTYSDGLEARWNSSSLQTQFVLESGILYPVIAHPETGLKVDNGEIRVCNPNNLNLCGWVPIDLGCRK